jgi:hypothetical protein
MAPSTTEKKHYIIECGIDELDFALDLMTVMKENGHHYVMNLKKGMIAIDVRKVSIEEFNEYMEL